MTPHPRRRAAHASEAYRRPQRRLAVELVEDCRCPCDFTGVATGLNNPRGLTFGSDGLLFVAEGRTASNTLSTVGQCIQSRRRLDPTPAASR
jgi:hypothetical protein